MKASSIWPGTNYAYKENLGRGRELPLNAKRVCALEITQEVIYGNTKKRTYVLVAFLDDEGSAITEGYYSTARKVLARDIVDFWDEYEQHREPLVEEKRIRDEAERERRRQYEIERQEREVVRSVWHFIYYGHNNLVRWKADAEKRRLEEIEKKRRIRIRNVLITRGIKGDKIILNGVYLQVPIDEIERWLGIVPQTGTKTPQ